MMFSFNVPGKCDVNVYTFPIIIRVIAKLKYTVPQTTDCNQNNNKFYATFKGFLRYDK
jgi:hypothetical protein